MKKMRITIPRAGPGKECPVGGGGEAWNVFTVIMVKEITISGPILAPNMLVSSPLIEPLHRCVITENLTHEAAPAF
jgi:hypothetical protein